MDVPQWISKYPRFNSAIGFLLFAQGLWALFSEKPLLPTIADWLGLVIMIPIPVIVLRYEPVLFRSIFVLRIIGIRSVWPIFAGGNIRQYHTDTQKMDLAEYISLSGPTP